MGWYCAERDEWDVGWQCPHCYGHINEFDQVAPTPEVAECVWDGTDEALEAIRAAFEGTANYASRDDNPSAGWGHSGCLWVGVGQQSSLVPPGWRIQPFGDSFVILPPEECQS